MVRKPREMGVGSDFESPTIMSDLTRILSQIESGDPQAAEQLLPLVYGELRKLAAQKLAHEKPGQTLQATALVHEAYLRLIGPANSPNWNSPGHFFAAAAEAMRRILIENARRKGRNKRGGNLRRIDLDNANLAGDASSDELLAIDDAIERLAREDPIAAQLVKIRYYAGLSVKQAGEAIGISRANAYKHWSYARAWLYCDLNPFRETNQAEMAHCNSG
jgi:RNA polymerase sigma factor (TIGR02999 family)